MAVKGIYFLKINNLYYIGRSHNIEERIRRHEQLLLRKRHPNPKIVTAYYEAKGVVESGVIETCSNEDILRKELSWISEFNADIEGLNMCATYSISNNYLVSPLGNVEPVNNGRVFCEKYNLEPSAVSRVLSGKAISHKGWTKYNELEAQSIN